MQGVDATNFEVSIDSRRTAGCKSVDWCSVLIKKEHCMRDKLPLHLYAIYTNTFNPGIHFCKRFQIYAFPVCIFAIFV